MSNPPSNFPTSLDTDANLKTVIDQNLPSEVGDDVIALHHNIIKNAIKAMQAKIGVNSSEVITSLDYLLTNASSDEPGHTHSSSAGSHTFDGVEHTDVNAMTEATGDTLYRTAGSLWERLAIGTTNQIMIVASGLPTWSSTLTVPSSFYATAGVFFVNYDGANEGAEVFMASPLGQGNETTAKPSWRYDVFIGSLRFRSWDGTTDKSWLTLDSANNVVKLNPFGYGNVSVFEDQTTSTIRYFDIFEQNSTNKLRTYSDGTWARFITSVGRVLYIKTDTGALYLGSDGGSVVVTPSLGNTIGGLTIMPSGTEDSSTLAFFNASDWSNRGTLLYQLDGAVARIISSVTGAGTEPSSFQINIAGDILLSTYGRGDVNLFKAQTTATQRYLDIYAPNSSNYLRLYHDDSNAYIDMSAGGLLFPAAKTLGFALGTTINEFSIDGTFAGNSDDAVPTEQAVVEYVTSTYTTENVDFTYQMQMEPFDGATWTYLNGLSILIDADTEKIHAVGSIPDGATQFKIKVYYEHNAASDTTYMQFKIDGKEDSETSLTNYYNTTAEWATTSANEEDIKDSGWQSLDAGDERIIVELERITAGGTDDIYIHAIVIEFTVPALVLNTGSQALTDFKTSMRMEPYDGATWDLETGMSIKLDSANEKVQTVGYLPANTTQFRVHILYQHETASDSTTIVTNIAGQEDDSVSPQLYTISSSDAWASTSANEQKRITFGWHTVDSDAERIYASFSFTSGDLIHISDVILEVRTPLSTYYTAATLSSSLPADMPASGTGGVSNDVSRADHVHPMTYNSWMMMKEFEGAIWNYTAGEHWIQLDAGTERANLNGIIPEGFNRYWIRLWYQNPASSQTGIWITIKDGAAFEGRYPNGRVSNDAPDLYISGNAASDWVYYEYGPYTITDNSESVHVNMQVYRNTSNLNVLGGEIRADTESS